MSSGFFKNTFQWVFLFLIQSIWFIDCRSKLICILNWVFEQLLDVLTTFSLIELLSEIYKKSNLYQFESNQSSIYRFSISVSTNLMWMKQTKKLPWVLNSFFIEFFLKLGKSSFFKYFLIFQSMTPFKLFIILRTKVLEKKIIKMSSDQNLSSFRTI